MNVVVRACKMTKPDNPYDAGRKPNANDDGSCQRKRWNPIEIVVSLAILGSIFTLLSPALYSGKNSGPTPDWMRHYIVPLSAPIYQRSATAILVLTSCLMGIGVLLAWVKMQRAVDTNSKEHRELPPEQTSNTAFDRTVSEKCTNQPMDRSGGSAAS